MCFGVIEKQGHALPVTIWSIRLDLLPVRASTPDRSRGLSAVQFNRFIRSRQRIEEAFDMRFPYTEGEVEVVLPIALWGVRFRLVRAGRPR